MKLYSTVLSIFEKWLEPVFLVHDMKKADDEKREKFDDLGVTTLADKTFKAWMNIEAWKLHLVAG